VNTWNAVPIACWTVCLPMIEFDIELQRGSFHLRANLASDAPLIGLFGPSGAGKSTLLNVLAGDISPAKGRILVNGRSLLDTSIGLNVPMHERGVGLVYQDGRLFPHFSVRGNLQYGMRLLRREKRFGFDQVVQLLELESLLDRNPAHLSGGERQRVSIGRALLSSPNILLLDEPLASLDARLKTQILPFLRRIKQETSIPIMYVSHSMQEILALTQHVAVMKAGSIVSSGNIQQIASQQQAFGVLHSMGIDNALHVRMTEHHADLSYSIGICGQHPLVMPLSSFPVGHEATLIIPASHVKLAKGAVANTTIQNVLPGTISAIKHLEHGVLVDMDVGFPLRAELTPKSVNDMKIRIGDQLTCLFDIPSQTG
jgi:molybdate transport system ATP-binding protein